jgi:hypothetical protein
MKDKFIVVDCMGIKQVGFKNEDGTTTFSPDALVSMLNAMNALNKELEQRVEGQLKALEVCGVLIQSLEDELAEVRQENSEMCP